MRTAPLAGLGSRGVDLAMPYLDSTIPTGIQLAIKESDDIERAFLPSWVLGCTDRLQQTPRVTVMRRMKNATSTGVSLYENGIVLGAGRNIRGWKAKGWRTNDIWPNENGIEPDYKFRLQSFDHIPFHRGRWDYVLSEYVPLGEGYVRPIELLHAMEYLLSTRGIGLIKAASFTEFADSHIVGVPDSSELIRMARSLGLKAFVLYDPHYFDLDENQNLFAQWQISCYLYK